MISVLVKKHEEQLAEEKKIYCFANGSIIGDVTINCSDGPLLTQSEMLILCSKWYQEYQLTFKTEDRSFPLKYNKHIVTSVLKTFYGEPTELLTKWKDVKQFFELAEYLQPHDVILEKLSEICDSYIVHIKHKQVQPTSFNDNQKLDYDLLHIINSYKSEDINKIFAFLSTSENKHIKKIRDAFKILETSKFAKLEKILLKLNP